MCAWLDNVRVSRSGHDIAIVVMERVMCVMSVMLLVWSLVA